MAKNGHFFIEFWPIFDIFHRLRPHLCSKGENLGLHKQATHRRRGDEPFFTLGSTVHDRGWPKNGPFWTKKGQIWQACQHSKVVQKGPKGTKMVNLSVFDHLGPIFGPSGPFRTISDNNEFCGPKWTKYCFLYREEVKNHVIFICFSFLLSDLSHKIWFLFQPSWKIGCYLSIDGSGKEKWKKRKHTKWFKHG